MVVSYLYPEGMGMTEGREDEGEGQCRHSLS